MARVVGIRGALRVLVGVVVVHPDHVELEERAALGQPGLIGDVVQARVHVAKDGMGGIGALLLDHVQHPVRVPFPARQVDHERQAGADRAPGGAAQAALFRLGEVGADADLADQADTRAPSPSTPRVASRTIWSAMASASMIATSGGCDASR